MAGIIPALIAVVTSLVSLEGAAAAAPPNPLLWQRQYVAPGGQVSNEEFYEIITPQCAEDIDRGTRSNGVTTPGAPKIAVVGDSTEVQTRRPAMADTKIRWEYATHCGEHLYSLVDEGRLGDALATNPDALIFGLGTNDLNFFWQIRRDRLPVILGDLNKVLDASESARCRVLVTLPEFPPPWATGQAATDWIWLAQRVNEAMSYASVTRHDLYVADYASRIAWFPTAYLQDGQHHTPTGINERFNLEIETARRCWAPDSPAGVHASPVDRGATVWWDPLPGPEKVTEYRVTASPGGRTVTTSQPTANIGGLVNGVAYTFSVEATNRAGTGEPSMPSPPATPGATGVRFHALAPERVLDTRSGVGGKATALGPGETYRLSLDGIVPPGASAAVLNFTATGQTEQTFVTVWPGGQSRPLSSNLNPRPGIDAVPALVVTRLAVDRSIEIFNNSGQVHLVADVAGWFGASGSNSGALFVPLAPERILDTRDGTGGKAVAFQTGETYDLALGSVVPPGASAVMLNVTSTNTTASSHLTMWPKGLARPVASNLNPQRGLTRANLTVAAIGADSGVSLFNHYGATDAIVDLVGYYTALGAPTGGSLYFPVTPERAFDTRSGTGGIKGRVASTVALGFAGRGVVPLDAAAVDINLTVTDQPGPGHVTMWPTWQPAPLASNVNYGRADVTANRVVTGLGAGAADLAPAGSSTHAVIDVAGWYGPPL